MKNYGVYYAANDKVLTGSEQYLHWWEQKKMVNSDTAVFSNDIDSKEL